MRTFEVRSGQLIIKQDEPVRWITIEGKRVPLHSSSRVAASWRRKHALRVTREGAMPAVQEWYPDVGDVLFASNGVRYTVWKVSENGTVLARDSEGNIGIVEGENIYR